MGKVLWYNKSPSHLLLLWGARVQWSLREKTTKLLASRCSHTDMRWKRHGPTKMKKTNMFRGRNHFSIPKAENFQKKKKKKPHTKTNTPKPHWVSIGRKSWRRRREKRSTAPEESSSGVRSIKSQPMNASKPNRGNRYKNQNPRGLWEHGAPHVLLVWATASSKRCVSSLSWSNAQLFCWDHKKKGDNRHTADLYPCAEIWAQDQAQTSNSRADGNRSWWLLIRLAFG